MRWLDWILGRSPSDLPPTPLPRPFAPAAADGRIDWIPLPNAQRAPNRDDPRLGRWLAPAEMDRLETERLPRRAQRCGPLTGSIALASLFLGRDGRAWSDREIARAQHAVLNAAAWIEQQAIRHNTPVNLLLSDTYFQTLDTEPEAVEIGFASEGDDVGPWEADSVTRHVARASRAAAQLGFHDMAHLAAWVAGQLPATQTVWILQPRCAGRSQAIPQEDSDLPGVDLAVCFAREASFTEPLTGPPAPDAVTIVHELLHLFGASDKYNTRISSYPHGSVTESDIMRLAQRGLSRMRIDPLTAAEIGWLDVAALKTKKA